MNIISNNYLEVTKLYTRSCEGLQMKQLYNCLNELLKSR